MQSLKTGQGRSGDASADARRRRMLPFLIEFVKFSTGFAVIVATALLTLHAATARVEQVAF